MQRLVMSVCTVALGVLAACGGDGDSGAMPADTSAPGTPTPEAINASVVTGTLMRLPSEYQATAAAALEWFFVSPLVFRAGNQCQLAGTHHIHVDGVAWPGKLAAGMHKVAARFDRCRFTGPWEDVVFNGNVDVAYDGTDGRNVAATVSMTGFSSFENWVVADGPATYSIAESSSSSQTATSSRQTAIEFKPGAVMTNSATTNRVEFFGGRYNTSGNRDASSSEVTQDFLSIVMELNGVRYTVDGRIIHRYQAQTSPCTGEVRIADGNGSLVARTYCTEDGMQRSELLKPVTVSW